MSTNAISFVHQYDPESLFTQNYLCSPPDLTMSHESFNDERVCNIEEILEYAKKFICDKKKWVEYHII